jgi:hypothetical protein
MSDRRDIEDRKLTTVMFLGILATVAVAGLVLAFVAGPAVSEAVAPGIGLKTAAIIAFCLTLGVIVVMAIAAGDGLLGEIQFMLAAFGGFFIISWLMIAWIF